MSQEGYEDSDGLETKKSSYEELLVVNVKTKTPTSQLATTSRLALKQCL